MPPDRLHTDGPGLAAAVPLQEPCGSTTVPQLVDQGSDRDVTGPAPEKGKQRHAEGRSERFELWIGEIQPQHLKHRFLAIRHGDTSVVFGPQKTCGPRTSWEYRTRNPVQASVHLVSNTASAARPSGSRQGRRAANSWKHGTTILRAHFATRKVVETFPRRAAAGAFQLLEVEGDRDGLAGREVPLRREADELVLCA